MMNNMHFEVNSDYKLALPGYCEFCISVTGS